MPLQDERLTEKSGLSFKRPVLSAMVFSLTVGILSVAYSAYTAVPANKTAGMQISSSEWNNMANDLSDHEARIAALFTQAAGEKNFATNLTSGTCAPSSTVGNWAPTATHPTTGQCNITPNFGVTVNNLVCSCTAITGSFAWACQFLTWPNTTSLSLKVHSMTGPAGADAAVTITCLAN